MLFREKAESTTRDQKFKKKFGVEKSRDSVNYNKVSRLVFYSGTPD